MRKPNDAALKLRADYVKLYAALATIEMMSQDDLWTTRQIHAYAKNALALTRAEIPTEAKGE